jgi:thiol-disulfide isomerase/thioredoxin
VALAFVIVHYVPFFSGIDKNPLSFVSRLESSGAIDFNSVTVEGKQFSLNEFQGKTIILSFWASWCSPCVEEFPSLLKLIKNMDNKAVLVAVSSDYNLEDINAFLKSYKSEITDSVYIVLDSDSKIGKLYEVERLPESFVFNKNFKLSRKVIGSVDWASEEALSYFKSL